MKATLKLNTMHLKVCVFYRQSFSLIVSTYTVTERSECVQRIGSWRRKGVGGKAGDLANCDMLDSMAGWALSIYGWLARSHGARHCLIQQVQWLVCLCKALGRKRNSEVMGLSKWKMIDMIKDSVKSKDQIDVCYTVHTTIVLVFMHGI